MGQFDPQQKRDGDEDGREGGLLAEGGLVPEGRGDAVQRLKKGLKSAPDTGVLVGVRVDMVVFRFHWGMID